MKIPEKIKIGGQEFSVVIDETTTSANFLGLCDVDALKITLSKKHSKAKQDQVFLHEILHAVYHTAAMDNIEGVKDKEEYIIDALSQGLYAVLKDNKLRF